MNNKQYVLLFCALTLLCCGIISCAPKTEKAKLDAGYGWSILDDEGLAVEESVNKMKSTVANPKLVILYTTVGYDVGKVLTSLRAKLENSQVFGITSCYAVVSKDGVHVGKKGSMAILGIDSAQLQVGVAGRELKDPANAKAAVLEAVHEAINRAGKKAGDKPDIILVGNTPGFEEKSIEAIEEIFGNKVPIYGGSAADNTIEGKWMAFSDEKMIPSGISLALIYTPTKIGAAFACGYGLGGEGQENGIVTEAEGRTLKMIDNKPAAEVYNTWTKGLVTEELSKGGSILAKSSFYPIAKKVKVGETDQLISLHPASIDPKTKSIGLFADIKEGEKIYLLKGDELALLNRSASVTQKAMRDSNIPSGNIGGGLHIYCAGTMLAVQKSIDKIVPQVNEVTAGAPFIGAFTFGEQGLLPGCGNFQGNLMNSMVLFSQE